MKHYLYAATLLFSIALVFQAQADACRSWDNSEEITVDSCNPAQAEFTEGGTQYNTGCNPAYPHCYKTHGAAPKQEAPQGYKLGKFKLFK